MTTENQGTGTDTIEITGLTSIREDEDYPGHVDLTVRAAGTTYHVVLMRDRFSTQTWVRAIYDAQRRPVTSARVDEHVVSMEAAIYSALGHILDAAYGPKAADGDTRDAA